MTQLELIKLTALTCALTDVQTKRCIDAYNDIIIAQLKKGDNIHTPIGAYYVGHRAARNGRNPSTGATIAIREKNFVRFKPKQLIKDAVN